MTSVPTPRISREVAREIRRLHEDALTALGAYIRTERIRRKVSCGELARAIGVSVPYMSDAERGRRGLTPARLGQIATYLGLDLDKCEIIGDICPACRGTGKRSPK